MAKSIKENQSIGDPFVGEIDYDEIEKIMVVGKGAFGTVYKAKWKDKLVAVKDIEAEDRRNTFRIELRQLSRVSHPNIIGLFGACTRKPNMCLVMEYADCGSLYNLLHCQTTVMYTASHAMSWARQCSEGVAHLHSMQPKPLIHRDLKPPNLLLVDHGRILKICDFGTVADKATQMTNNMGSAAWMAPEVFESQTYSEKCDVFSWGIILWEVLSREQPYKGIESAYGIMWSVHKGQRPALLEGCPKPIENLMTSCWNKEPAERPGMETIVEIMQILCEYFPHADKPLDYRILDENYDNTFSEDNMDTNPSTSSTMNDKILSQTKTNGSTLAKTQNYLPEKLPSHTRQEVESSIEEFSKLWSSEMGATNHSTLGAQRVNQFLDSGQENTSPNPISANYSKRNGVLKSGGVPLPPISLEIDPHAWDLPQTSNEQLNLSNNQSNDRLTATESRSNAISGSSSSTFYNNNNQNALNTGNPTIFSRRNATYEYATNFRNDDNDLDSMHLMLEPHLRPPQPDPNSELSKQIFEEHKKLANEYLKIQTEMAYVTKHREEILSKMDPKERQQRLEYSKKLLEKEELLKFRANLKRQLQLIQMNTRPPQLNTVPTVAPQNLTTVPTYERQNIDLSSVTNEDGWVLVSSQNESDA